MSLSARRAWIEIAVGFSYFYIIKVALRKESVDRNFYFHSFIDCQYRVALRKESVDRNDVIRPAIDVFLAVALRKESVDRNTSFSPASLFDLRRSPQGERG